MNIRLQTLFLIIFIFISVTFTKFDSFVYSSDTTIPQSVTIDRNASSFSPPQLQLQRASLLTSQSKILRAPLRKWEVLDPVIDAEAVFVQSLDDNFPLLRMQSESAWPLASLTKLLTAIVVSETIGMNKKIPINETALQEEGIAGGLKAQEIYTAQDLVKIMLLTSSNDAAAAFEEYVGGKNALAKMINEKIRDIGMMGTIVYDGSGLASLNESTALDLLRLTQYLVEHHPDILTWTRLPQFLVQPINDVTARTVYNINPFVERNTFLGGKTGTSPEARENLVALFSFNTHRIVVIILGSHDRVRATELLLEWIRRAYTFS